MLVGYVRVPVPRAFCRTDCTDYLAAVALSGGDIHEFTPVFLECLHWPLESTRATAKNESIDFGDLGSFADSAPKFYPRLLRQGRQAKLLEQAYQQASERFAPDSPKVLGLRKKKAEQLQYTETQFRDSRISEFSLRYLRCSLEKRAARQSENDAVSVRDLGATL